MSLSSEKYQTHVQLFKIFHKLQNTDPLTTQSRWPKRVLVYHCRRITFKGVFTHYASHFHKLKVHILKHRFRHALLPENELRSRNDSFGVWAEASKITALEAHWKLLCGHISGKVWLPTGHHLHQVTRRAENSFC